MTESQSNNLFSRRLFVCFSIGLVALNVNAAPSWSNNNGNSDFSDSNGCGGPKFDRNNFMNFGCGSNNLPSGQAFRHLNANILKNLPPGANTTLIPLGQVLIPTNKEVCCCTNNPNGPNRNLNNGGPNQGRMFGNNGGSGFSMSSYPSGGFGSPMGGNSGGYGSSMGGGFVDNCCQGYGGNPYANGGAYGAGGNGNFMGNGMANTYMGGGQGYGFGGSNPMGNQMGNSMGGQMGSFPSSGDYSNGCGNNGGMDGCCPCCSKKRRRRFVNQLFSRLMGKRLYHSKPPMSPLNKRNF